MENTAGKYAGRLKRLKLANLTASWLPRPFHRKK
jgi:hypothetical protein